MGFLKGMIWSGLCIGLGIFLASKRFDGRTAVEHAERTFWGQMKTPSFNGVKDELEGAIDLAKKKLAAKETPTEKHTAEDKEAVNKLIARRKP